MPMPRACFVVNDQWQDDSEVAKCLVCSTTAIRIVITLIITISINIAIPTAILRIMRIIIGISRLLCRWPRRQQWREPSPC